MVRWTVATLLVFGASAGSVAAQEPAVDLAAEVSAAPAEPAEVAAPPFRIIPGPVEGKLGDLATIQVSEGYGFVEKSEMQKLNEATHNLHNPNDMGALLGPNWLVFFSWDDIGYVKDDDKDDLDPDALMKTFQEGQEQANQVRKERGFEALHLLGWETKPFYDATTNNLTWATKLQTEGAQGYSVNHNVRLLGRRGVMSATLVGAPEAMPEAVAALTDMLGGFHFADGQRYDQFEEGDKIFEYGLGALVLGGGAALAVKTGLFGHLGKFIKVIVLAVVGFFAAVGKKIKKFFGGGEA